MFVNKIGNRTWIIENMTRRVRSGSSQKHKKMPGDATKWGEFDNQHAREFSPKKNNKSQKDVERKLKFSPSDCTDEKSLNANFFDESNFSSGENLDNLIEKKDGTFDVTDSNVIHSAMNNDHDNNIFSKNKGCDREIKKKLKKQKKNCIKYSSFEEKSDEIDLSEQPKTHKKIKLENNCQNIKIFKQDDNHNDFAENSKNPEELSVQDDKKKRKKEKNRKSYDKNDFEKSSDVTVEASLSDSISFVDSNEFKEQRLNIDSNQSSVNHESCKKSKVLENKKEKYLKKLQRKREKLGLLVLPRNAECKLHKIKKRLMEKGLPPEKQKEIMRQARRKEELKYRKVFNPSKLCFGCREPRHVLADCPQKSESLKQETGICFKCGSVEHTSYKCPNKVQGFPYAKCFICKEQGHISRECPTNKHGIYPKGGRCKLCGNVNHLQKDCPTLKKKKENEDETITLHTLDADASIDAEVVEKKEIKKKTKKKAKIVKF